MASVRMAALALAFVCASMAPACESGRAECEHARDVFMAHAQTQLDEALEGATPEQLAQLQTEAAAELERGRAVFVDECMKLRGADKACVERLDELVEIDARRRAAHRACPPDKYELPDLDCLDRANAAADAELGDCKEPLGRLGEAVWSRAAVE